MTKTKRTPVVTWLTIAAVLISMCASLTFSQRTEAQFEKKNQSDSRPALDNKYPILSKYATDLTLLALIGKLEPSSEPGVALVIASLSKTDKAPLVIGDSDLVRDEIARGVAFRIAFGDVPETLRNKHVFRLSLEALAKGAQTSEVFESRVQAVFAEAETSQGQVILFVDQMHQYAGARATSVASATVKAAIEANHFKVIGGASPAAYSNYIATDESVAKLFDSISIDGANESAADTTVAKDKRKSPIKEEFEGDKISSDMRDLIKSAGPNGRVTAILQVDDVNNPEVRALLARNGVLVADRMAELGAMKVELPAKAVAELAKSGLANYISPEVKMESFGQVTAATGTDLIRTQTNYSLLGLPLSTTTFD
ncbi:MAG TPA: hypothetical protein VK475_00330, partial [Pyrinomonadaceae bacterium]|nr:hypothetical protein [Pyrinomonadaceae bacterium]